jgi:hypothetical protein
MVPPFFCFSTQLTTQLTFPAPQCFTQSCHRWQGGHKALATAGYIITAKYVHHVEPSFTTPRKRHEQCLIHRLAKESIKTRLCRRVARIHKIVTEEIQPKQHVSLPMTLRCSLACRKCKRIYRIHALDANSSHLRKLICFNYIRATSMDVPRLASASCNVATWKVGCRHLFGLLTQPRRRFCQISGQLAESARKG